MGNIHVIQENKKFGLYHSLSINKGEWIMAAQYDSLEVTLLDSIRSNGLISESYYSLKTNDKYGLIYVVEYNSSHPILVLKPQFDSIKREYDFCYIISKNNKYGIIYADTLILEPCFSTIKVKKLYDYIYQIEADQKKGIIDKGRWVESSPFSK